MKKILCLILTLSFVLCSVGYTPLAADTDDELSEALVLFTAMGLAEDGEDLQRTLTRADFAFRLAQFMNIDVYNNDGVSYFSDVPDTMWSKAAINALAERKFVVGSNGLFMPDKNISGTEALKLMLMLSGYNAEAEARGGWYSGYLLTASRLKLTKDITLGDTITAGDFYLMLYRTAQLNYMMAEAVEGDSVVYSADGSDTVLEFYHDIHYIEGRVTAVGASALSSGKGCENGEIMLDGEVYKNPNESIDFYSYLGHEVKMYFHSVKENDKTAVCIISGADTNESTTIYSKDLGKVTDNGRYYTLVYYDDDTEREIKIDRGAVVLKNGVGVTNGIYDALNINHGYMTLLSYDGDSVCDVVRVNDGYDMVIGNINNENADVVTGLHVSGHFYNLRAEVGTKVILYDKYNPALITDISLDDKRVIRLRNSNGMNIDYDDLSVGDVVTIYKSDDNTHVEVIKGMGSVTGTLDTYSSSSAEAVIGDITYNLTDTCLKNHKKEISVGMDAKYVLNCFGEIAYFEITERNTKLAYLIAMNYEDKGLSNTMQLKFYTVDGEMKILDVAKNVQIDGVMINGYSNIASALSTGNGTIEPKVVVVGVNSNNMINYIDLPGIGESESEDTLIKTGEGSGMYYAIGRKIITMPNCLFDNSKTRIFLVPTDVTLKSGDYEDDWFAIKRMTDINSGDGYSISSYRIGLHSDYEDAIVIKRNNEWGAMASTSPMLIEGISRGIDENGDVVDIVTAYTSGQNYKKYYVKNSSVLAGKNIQKGDLVWFMMDINGRIVEVKEIFYKADGGKQFQGDFIAYSGASKADIAPATGIGSSLYLEDVYATEVSGDVLRYGYEMGEIENSCYIPSSIYVIDTSSGSTDIHYASKTEIADYLMAGSSCSKLLVYSSVYTAWVIYIYK